MFNVLEGWIVLIYKKGFYMFQLALVPLEDA